MDKSPVCFYDVNGRNTPGPTTPPRSNFRATSVVTEPIPDTRPRDTQISHNGECIRFGTVQSVMVVVVVVVKERCPYVASDRKPLAYRRLDNTTAAPRARTNSPVGFRIHTATGSRRGKAWSDYSLNKTVVRVHNKLRQLLLELWAATKLMDFFPRVGYTFKIHGASHTGSLQWSLVGSGLSHETHIPAAAPPSRQQQEPS